MIDLIVRLRNWERVYSCDEGKPDGSLYLEAADRIEELEAAYKEADEQFHRLADQRDKLHSDYTALVDGLRNELKHTFFSAGREFIHTGRIRALLGDEDG